MLKIFFSIVLGIFLGIVGVFFLPFLSLGCFVVDPTGTLLVSNFVSTLFEKISSWAEKFENRTLYVAVFIFVKNLQNILFSIQ
jgi:hypothetical protein